VAVPLYIERGLHLTALLFVIYIVIAVIGYISWRKHYRNNGQCLAD
jgi:nicotinamide mononucleotide transporter